MNATGVAAKRAATRARSPEGKPNGARARSPITSKPSQPHNVPLRPAVASPPLPVAAPPSGRGVQPAAASKRGSSTTVEEIKKIDLNREQRRRVAEEAKNQRQEEQALLKVQCGGVVPDIDFHRMIRDFTKQCPSPSPIEPLDPNISDGIFVCVRKRPIQAHEVASRELDCVTACNPFAIIHERKFKVDGITKCLESHQFEFDRVFDDEHSSEEVYNTISSPLVPWVIDKGGRVTLFAYGQTGSGKTHTMTGIQRQLAEQLFQTLSSMRGGPAEQLSVSVSFFEIYGGRPYDLLNNRQKLETLEDAKNEVQIAGLTERPAHSPQDMLQYIELGNSLRTTHATAINRDSSRSHAVCAVFLRTDSSPSGIHGKVTLVDLAGSERAADSKSSIRQRRVEGAQINKSLLALKECIRAMGDPRESHVPFRASKLTLVLRDAFVSRCPTKTVMIACISPGMSSADHSVNTLRYSDRLKDRPRPPRSICEPRGSLDHSAGGDSTGLPPARDAKSPEPRTAASRRRSPSPGGDAGGGGLAGSHNLPLRLRAANASAPELPKDEPIGPKFDDEAVLEVEEEAAAPVSAWGEVAALDCAAGEVPRGGRQPVPRRGRQPTLRPRETTAPNRPDALGSRATGSSATAERGSTAPGPDRPAAPAERAADRGAVPSLPSRETVVVTAPPRESSLPRDGGAAPNGVGRSPRLRDRSPEPSLGSRAGDLRQQDNRYLHNTLTSEVFEAQRGGRAAAPVVDVGVEDLTDLAHMEALDEVRQWEDRIVSQHMVALQEDARLLTVESELLSQVQQGASYDIDWYVSEVDKVVRRKMEVYASFLDELEVFKAQLRREESLSRSCQRNRGSGLADNDAGPQSSPRAAARDVGLVDATPQRTPRTPRPSSVAALSQKD